MWRSLASNALTVLIVLILGVGIVVGWAQSAYRAPGPLAEAICLGVERGGNMGDVSMRLAEQNAVSHPALFRLGAEYTDRAEELKAGNFLIPPGASMEAIVDEITATGQSTCGSEINLLIGVASSEVQVRELDPETRRYTEIAAFAPGDTPPSAYDSLLEDGFGRFRVTLAEGATSWQVADSLRRAPFLDGNVEFVPDEGTLAPGSYEVDDGTEREAVLAQMRERQQEVMAAAWAGRAQDLPLQSASDALVLASIVEKETGIAEERRRVAGVFVNRLNDGMRLQTDPTVIYGITGGEGVLGRGLRASELRRATPYNTYVIDGLPPTPIANPGQAAIEAALNPETHDYLFFVADGTGGHVFAETLAEHNGNVRRWREIEAQQNAGQ
ncbi:MAG: endolytic transglycosylase MltG [Pseudomonadota bacterium]